MLRAFERYGSTAVPMHMALFAIPLTLAVRLRIPLALLAAVGLGGGAAADEAQTGFRLDAAWLRAYGVTHGTSARDWVGDGFTEKELSAYFAPEDAELEAAGVSAVFLGYYFPWDPEETRRVAAAHGFRGRAEGARTGYYDYADIDDEFISIHHWMKWYKFGFTRLFDNLSLEIRNGRMTRAQAVELVARTGEQTPHADIERFCAFAGIPRSRFDAIAESFRNPAVWQRDGGTWRIPGFLVPDWKWSA